jgi:hypothetical protein
MDGMMGALGGGMETTTEQAMQVAETILSQIPRMTQWELGIEKRWAIKDKMGGVELVLGGASITRGKRVRIVLEPSDTYSVEVYKIGRKGSKNWGQKVNAVSCDDVYCDQLAETVRGLVFG